MAPALQLWDLRNSVSPLRELRGHRAGVLGLSWCPQDPAFLISSAKDNRCRSWHIAQSRAASLLSLDLLLQGARCEAAPVQCHTLQAMLSSHAREDELLQGTDACSAYLDLHHAGVICLTLTSLQPSICNPLRSKFQQLVPMCRTIVWDVSAGVELAELPPSGNWNFAAAWSPTNPGVFATASFDGKARSLPAGLVPRDFMPSHKGSVLVNCPVLCCVVPHEPGRLRDRPASMARCAA